MGPASKVVAQTVAKETAEIGAELAGKAVATEVAAQGAAKAAQGAAKASTMTSTSMLAKATPFVGLGLGLVFGARRLYNGQPMLAAAEVSAGVLSLVPSWGTAASIAVSASIGAADVYGAMYPSDPKIGLVDPIRARFEKNKEEFNKVKYGKWQKVKDEVEELKKQEKTSLDHSRDHHDAFKADGIERPPDSFEEEIFMFDWADFDYSESQYCAGQGGAPAGNDMICINAEGSSSVLKDEMYMRALRKVYCANALAKGIQATDKRMTECQIVGCGNSGKWTLHVQTGDGRLGVINGCPRCNNALSATNPVNQHVNPYGVKVKPNAHFMTLNKHTPGIAFQEPLPYDKSTWSFNPVTGPKK